jgi:hypothetical protein
MKKILVTGTEHDGLYYLTLLQPHMKYGLSTNELLLLHYGLDDLSFQSMSSFYLSMFKACYK